MVESCVYKILPYAEDEDIDVSGCAFCQWLSRRRRLGGGEECSHCHLVFDDTTLLDLHVQAHTASGNCFH